MKLTIATWNMDHWKRTPAQRRAAWQRLQNSDYDIVLLQETTPPADVRRQDVVWREIGRERRFGSAVVSLKGSPIEEISTAKSCESYLAFPLLGTFPGSVAIARVHPPGLRPVTAVSVYTVIDVYATTTLFRQVADLIPLFDSVHGDRIVLGGDLNISTQTIGNQWARYKAAFGAVESLGLVDLFRTVNDRPRPMGADCECKLADCYHVTTHRNAARAAGAGLHLDYLFASEALATRCNRLQLDDDAPIWELSDHCPVVAEIELEEMTGPTPWDERYATDIAETLRSILSEPRDWGIWKPGASRPVVRTDRSLTKWIIALWEGSLDDGRRAQIELGIWRAPDKTGHALVAHAGLHGKPMTDKLTGVEVVAPVGSRAKLVEMPNNARYLVVPCEPSGLPPEQEIRTVLDALMASIRK
jgi:endonuclease/exonuclease/phosphatase family metal-dependent hydrolase